MSIPAVVNPSITYKGDGSTRRWEYPYDFASYDVIKLRVVQVDGSITDVTNNYTYEPGSKYIIYPVNGAPLTSQEKLIMYRKTPIEQNAVLPSTYPFANISKQFDYMTMILQEQQGLGSRGIHFKETSEFKNITIPDGEKLALIGWNAEGKALVNYPFEDFESLSIKVLNAIDSAEMKSAALITTSQEVVERLAKEIDGKVEKAEANVVNKVREYNAEIERAAQKLQGQYEIVNNNFQSAKSEINQKSTTVLDSLQQVQQLANRTSTELETTKSEVLQKINGKLGELNLDAINARIQSLENKPAVDLSEYVTKVIYEDNEKTNMELFNTIQEKLGKCLEKQDISHLVTKNDLTNYETKENAVATYATKSDLNNISDLLGNDKNLAENGFYKLPGGLIIQWGICKASTTWTYPIAFSKPPLCAFFQPTKTYNGETILARNLTAFDVTEKAFLLGKNWANKYECFTIAIGI